MKTARPGQNQNTRSENNISEDDIKEKLTKDDKVKIYLKSLDLFKGIISAGKEAVSYLKEREKTKQTEINAQKEIIKARIELEKETLKHIEAMEKLSNEKLEIQVKAAMVKRSLEYCDYLIQSVSHILRISEQIPSEDSTQNSEYINKLLNSFVKIHGQMLELYKP